MSLSDHEQQQLDDLERSFYHSEADEKRPARTLPTRAAVLLGILLVLVAIGLLILSVIVKILLVGVLALLVMAGGAVLMSTPRDRISGAVHSVHQDRTTPGSSSRSRRSFADVMRDRWQRRQS